VKKEKSSPGMMGSVSRTCSSSSSNSTKQQQITEVFGAYQSGPLLVKHCMKV
jgi:hypothetical protein